MDTNELPYSHPTTMQEFLIDVRNELDHLRRHATDEEKSKLDFDTFIYSSQTACIYGQMTNRYCSNRAYDLWPKRYADIARGSYVQGNIGLFLQSGCVVTALEKYIYICVKNAITFRNEKHREIIDYIKGDIETISL